MTSMSSYLSPVSWCRPAMNLHNESPIPEVTSHPTVSRFPPNMNIQENTLEGACAMKLGQTMCAAKTKKNHIKQNTRQDVFI